MVAPATITVFDNLYTAGGAAVVGATVQCVLNGSTETTSGGLISPAQQATTTDSAGRFAFTVVCNDLLSPVNSTYTIVTPFRTYDIAPQSANGSPQQTTAANVIVNTPSPLAPATSNLTGPLTVAGLLTAQAGLAVTGNETISGNLSVGGTFTPSAITVAPGEPGIDTATAGALLLGDNTATSIELGAATTVSAGTLTVAAGLLTASVGLTVVGAVTLPAASIADAALSANIPLINAANNSFTGDLTLTAGELIFTDAASQINPGATSFAITNNAANANNLILTDAGLATLRNALTVPPSAGAALPSTSYGTVPVKLDEQSTASGASVTLTVPAGALFRSLRLDITGRSDQGGAQGAFMQFNADAGANYDHMSITDSNTTLVGNAPTIAGTSGFAGTLCASGATAGAVGNSTVFISNADSTTLRKVWRVVFNRFDTDAAASAVWGSAAGQWRNTANAITSIKIIPGAGNLVNFRAILYGEP